MKKVQIQNSVITSGNFISVQNLQINVYEPTHYCK